MKNWICITFKIGLHSKERKAQLENPSFSFYVRNLEGSSLEVNRETRRREPIVVRLGSQKSRRAFLINVTFSPESEEGSGKGDPRSSTPVSSVLSFSFSFSLLSLFLSFSFIPTIAHPFFLKNFFATSFYPCGCQQTAFAGMKINSFRLNRIKV